MRSRKMISALWASALLFGILIGSSVGVVHAADERGKGNGKGKAGDLCKTASDCQQTPRSMICREADGVSKCYVIPVHAVT